MAQAVDRRRKDDLWFVADQSGQMKVVMSAGIIVAVLMDLRDELKQINKTLKTISRKLPPRPKAK